MPKKYVKLPVEIEAVVWDGENIHEILDLNNGRRTLQFSDKEEPGKLTLRIYTLEGWHKADIGDYIIKGIKGELYPCKPDIFEKTYTNIEVGSESAYIFFADNGNKCMHQVRGSHTRLLAALVCMIAEVTENLNAGRISKRFFRDMSIRMLEDALEVPHRIRFYCTKRQAVFLVIAGALAIGAGIYKLMSGGLWLGVFNLIVGTVGETTGLIGLTTNK